MHFVFLLLSCVSAQLHQPPRVYALDYYTHASDGVRMMMSVVPVSNMMNTKVKIRRLQSNYIYELTPMSPTVNLPQAVQTIVLEPYTRTTDCVAYTYRDIALQNCGLPSNCVALVYKLLDTVWNNRPTMLCLAIRDDKIHTPKTIYAKVADSAFDDNLNRMVNTYPKNLFPWIYDDDMTGMSRGNEIIFVPKFLFTQSTNPEIDVSHANLTAYYINYKMYPYYDWWKLINVDFNAAVVTIQISLSNEFKFVFACTNYQPTIDSLKYSDPKIDIYNAQDCGELIVVGKNKAYCSRIYNFPKRRRCPLDFLPRLYNESDKLTKTAYISSFPYIFDHEKV